MVVLLVVWAKYLCFLWLLSCFYYYKTYLTHRVDVPRMTKGFTVYSF